MKIILEVSNRHIHLDEKTKNILFGKSFKLVKKRALSQTGEFASTSTITIKNKNKVIENIRIVGPLRKYTQLELSKSDARYLGVKAPRRNSGELKKSGNITLIGPLGKIYKRECVISAKRHLHLDPKTAEVLSLKQNDKVKVNINGKIMKGIHVKINSKFNPAFHIDKDEANAYNVDKITEVEFKN